MITSLLTFTINEKNYEISFPNNRQYIAIQNAKATLASQYAELKFMGAEAEFAELLVDTIAHLQILAPDLIKDMNVSMLDLDLMKGRELSIAYAKQFRPWYNQNLNFIFEVNKDEPEEPTK